MTINQTTTAVSAPTLTQQELFAIFAKRHGAVEIDGKNDAVRDLARRIMSDAARATDPELFLSDFVESVQKLRWGLQDAFSDFSKFKAAHALSDAETEDRYHVPPSSSDTLANPLHGEELIGWRCISRIGGGLPMNDLSPSLQLLVSKPCRQRRRLDQLAARFGYMLWPKDIPKPRVRVPCHTRQYVSPGERIAMDEIDEILAGLNHIR